MKTNRKISITFFATIFALLAPLTTLAADFGQSILKGTSLPGSSPSQFITNIINAVTGLLGVVLVGMLVYGGALYLSSAGNEQAVESAKKTITYAIVGIIVIAAARIIAEFVIGAIT